MTYSIKFVNFTLGAPLKNLGRWRGVRALPALYGSYAHAEGTDRTGKYVDRQASSTSFYCHCHSGTGNENAAELCIIFPINLTAFERMLQMIKLGKRRTWR